MFKLQGLWGSKEPEQMPAAEIEPKEHSRSVTRRHAAKTRSIMQARVSTIAPRKKSFLDQTGDFFESKLVNTLLKPPNKRSSAEIDVLVAIAQSKEFFANFQTQHGSVMLRELLKLCYYEFVPANEVVFEVDSNGAEYYIILNGKVDFYTKSSLNSLKPDKSPAGTAEEKLLKPIHRASVLTQVAGGFSALSVAHALLSKAGAGLLSIPGLNLDQSTLHNLVKSGKVLQPSGRRFRSTYQGNLHSAGAPKAKPICKTQIVQLQDSLFVLFDGSRG